MIDDRRRRTAGLAAYASQFDLPASEVEAHLSSVVGVRMAEEAICAAGGGLWEDRTLSLRERSMIALSSLITQGSSDSRLRAHIRSAVRHGVSAEQIEELTTVLAVYAGYPRAATAMELVRDELAAPSGEA